MGYPEYVDVEGELYKINTDFRYAIMCDQIARDETIDDYERGLAVLYVLYGDKGINASNEHKIQLLEKAKRYLSCDKEIEITNEEPDMDYVQDMDYIEASFMSDFHIDLSKEEMHWWKFNKLINGLSNSDMGNCCILNRIRNLRNYDLKTISDSKEKRRIKEAQDMFALKKNKEVELTEEQKRSIEQFYRLTNS